MADAGAKGKTFSPVPARVVADEGLSALDLRVLATIAAHDRFGANGIGCYASHPRLAALVRCNPKSLSRSMRRLAELGYVEAAPHPMNRRLRVYRVVYNAQDKAVMQSRIGNETVTNGAPGGGPIGNHPVTDDPPIGNRDFQKAEQLQEDADVNIFREAGSISGETLNETSSEEAPPDGDAHATRNERHPRQQIAQRLREIEDVLRDAKDRPLTKGEQDWLRHHQPWCAEIEDAYAHDDDPVSANLGFQAQRVLGDIDWHLEGA